nr:MAG TPA: hypothetical protein [Caudoviricetes sp.]
MFNIYNLKGGLPKNLLYHFNMITYIYVNVVIFSNIY